MDTNKNFVDLIDETVEILRTPAGNDPRDNEKVIRDAWSCDNNERRAAFKNFAEFRQHVLNVLDAS